MMAERKAAARPCSDCSGGERAADLSPHGGRPEPAARCGRSRIATQGPAGRRFRSALHPARRSPDEARPLQTRLLSGPGSAGFGVDDHRDVSGSTSGHVGVAGRYWSDIARARCAGCAPDCAGTTAADSHRGARGFSLASAGSARQPVPCWLRTRHARARESLPGVLRRIGGLALGRAPNSLSATFGLVRADTRRSGPADHRDYLGADGMPSAASPDRRYCTSSSHLRFASRAVVGGPHG